MNEITQLKNTDERALVEINTLLVQLSSSGKQLTPEGLKEIVDDPNAILLTVRDSGRIIGMGELLLMHTPTGRRGRIEDVVVDAAYRGQGLGRKLTEALISEARTRGLANLELTSRPSRTEANALYQKMGFEKKETNVYVMKL